MEKIWRNFSKILIKVVDIDTSITEPIRKVSFEVDHEKALESGISTTQIFETLSTITNEIDISQFHLKDSPVNSTYHS